MTEHWKTIANFEAYEVSDLGRVRRRLPGRTWNRRMGRTLAPCKSSCNGYLSVCLCIDGKHTMKTVHRLVAEAFLPNLLGLPHVNHKGEKMDNRACKLEWRSTAGHGQDQARRGQHGTGITHKKGKYEAIIYLGSFPTYKEAAKTRKDALASLPYIL